MKWSIKSEYHTTRNKRLRIVLTWIEQVDKARADRPKQSFSPHLAHSCPTWVLDFCRKSSLSWSTWACCPTMKLAKSFYLPNKINTQNKRFLFSNQHLVYIYINWKCTFYEEECHFGKVSVEREKLENLKSFFST